MSALLNGGDDHAGADAIQVMAMKASKGLEFSVEELPRVRNMPAHGADLKEAARGFCVAATRATQRLVMGVSAVREGRLYLKFLAN